MRVGIDSYSYHRLLGEVRAGERPVPAALTDPAALAAEMVGAGAEVLSLETVFLGAPGALDAGALLDAAGDREIVLAWGHPYGIRWGEDCGEVGDLLAWIDLAPSLGVRLVRCVAAHPALRDADRRARLHTTAKALRRATAHARACGIALALENHGDVDEQELTALLTAVPGLQVCLDTANALRVGDDPVRLARRVAERVAMVHLKDVEDPAGADPLVGPRSVAYGTGVVDLRGVLEAVGALHPDSALPVCVELAQLGGGDVDERALVRQGVEWLRAARAEHLRA